MKRTALYLFTIAFLSSGCEAAECKQMKACCAEVADAEWSGDACGEMAQNVRDPQTCRTIVESIRHSLETREETVPEPCR